MPIAQITSADLNAAATMPSAEIEHLAVTSNSENNCDINAVCFNTKRDFACSCTDGYSGDGVICSDIGECANGSDNCSANGSCSNTDEGFACSCNDGFNGDGMGCNDNDECALATRAQAFALITFHHARRCLR